MWADFDVFGLVGKLWKTREADLKIWKDKHSFVTSKTATKVEG